MNLQLCPLKLFYIVYNPNRLRHFVPDKTSLSYITYRRLIKKHRQHRRHRKRVFHDDDDDDDQKDRTAPAVRSEPTVVSDELRDLSCPVAEDTTAAESTPVTSSSSSVKDSTSINSCTAVLSRSSFSIMRLLSLSEDNSSGDDEKTSPDADVRKLSSASLSAVGPAPADSVASQDGSAAVAGGGLKDLASVACAEGKPVAVHFKKRMLSTATVTHPSSTVSEPAVVGKSTTPRRSFTIHQDAVTSTPPAKVGIVISHGRAMTLQDKLQMTTNGARRSPSSGGGSLSAASPLRVLNRQAITPAASHHKPKRRSKPVAKRSLIPSPKVRCFVLCYKFFLSGLRHCAQTCLLSPSRKLNKVLFLSGHWLEFWEDAWRASKMGRCSVDWGIGMAVPPQPTKGSA